MFSLQNRKAALCPDFSQTHHRKIRRCTDAAVSSEESGIAAAGQNSSPGGICFKTCFPSAAMGTVCAGSLITAQILACGLIAVQSVIGQKFPFRTYETIPSAKTGSCVRTPSNAFCGFCQQSIRSCTNGQDHVGRLVHTQKGGTEAAIGTTSKRARGT